MMSYLISVTMAKAVILSRLSAVVRHLQCDGDVGRRAVYLRTSVPVRSSLGGHGTREARWTSGGPLPPWRNLSRHRHADVPL